MLRFDEKIIGKEVIENIDNPNLKSKFLTSSRNSNNKLPNVFVKNVLYNCS
jgi:hypothetical protein